MHVLDLVRAHPAEAAVAALAVGPLLARLLPHLSSWVEIAARWAVNAIVVRRRLVTEQTCEDVLRYLQKASWSTGLTESAWWLGGQRITTETPWRTVAYRIDGWGTRLFVYRGAPLVFAQTRLDQSGSPEWAIYHLRGTVRWEHLLCEVARESDARKDSTTVSRYHVTTLYGTAGANQESLQSSSPSLKAPGPTISSEYISGHKVPLNYRQEELDQPRSANPLEAVSLTPGLRRFLEESRFWLTHRDWYRERSIAWQHGFLLHGRPGNGKTTGVRTVAQVLDLPVYLLRLSTMTDSDFVNAWLQVRGSSRMMVLEDIDVVFHGRTCVLPGRVSFDTLLNAIQGVEEEDGMLLVVTTNHLDHVDPALGRPEADGTSSRPGRVDSVIEIVDPELEARLKIARRVLRDEVLAEKLAIEGAGQTAAQFTDACKRVARDLLWGRA